MSARSGDAGKRLLERLADRLATANSLPRTKKLAIGLVVAIIIRQYRVVLSRKRPPLADGEMPPLADIIENLSSTQADDEQETKREDENKRKGPASMPVVSRDGKSDLVGRSKEKKQKNKRAIMDKKFHKSMKKLLSIALRGWRVKIKFVLFLGTLFTRTTISMQISAILGLITRHLVSRDRKAFNHSILQLLLMSIPASLINSMLSYFASSISTDLCNNVVGHLHEKYFSENMAYLVLRLHGNGMSDVDQRITQDTEEWASSCILIFQSLVKPTIDVILYSRALMQRVGVEGPLIMLGYFLATSGILRFMSPGFGKITSRVQKLMGFYRFLHMRFAARAEEISFSYGSNWEKAAIEGAQKSYNNQQRFLQRQSFLMSLLDNFTIKYGATTVGFGLVLGRLAFNGEQDPNETEANIAQRFVASSRMLTILSDAVGRLVLSYKQIAVLAGFTERVSKVVDVLEGLEKETLGDGRMTSGVGEKKLRRSSLEMSELEHEITFQDLQIRIPGFRATLLRGLRGSIKKGQHTLIAGPNGCGKTCLLRVIRGLWPSSAGSISKPRLNPGNSSQAGTHAGVMYLPQMPYMPIGTLVDCIIYPHKRPRLGGLPLERIFQMADLDKVVKREGLTQIKQWDDILSGGESQKVAMARAYYHSPDFAILDEATSMVSASLEPRLYKQLQALGTTVVSIAHRVAVWKFHTHVLRYSPAKDGEGFYAKIEPFTEELMENLVKGYDSTPATTAVQSQAPTGAIREESSGTVASLADRKGLNVADLRRRVMEEAPFMANSATAKFGSEAEESMRRIDQDRALKKSYSMQELRRVPKSILRSAFVGADWKWFCRRAPEVQANFLRPVSSMFNLRGTAATMFEDGQRDPLYNI